MPSRNRAREQTKARQRAELEAEGIDPTKKKAGKKKAGKKKTGSKTKRRRSVGGASGKPRGTAGKATGRPKRPASGPMHDPSADERSEVRFVMAGDAVKTYICPGCNRDIPPGVGHIVAVPPDAPDLRRHWHRGCWEHRHTRF